MFNKNETFTKIKEILCDSHVGWYPMDPNIGIIHMLPDGKFTVKIDPLNEHSAVCTGFISYGKIHGEFIITEEDVVVVHKYFNKEIEVHDFVHERTKILRSFSHKFGGDYVL